MISALCALPGSAILCLPVAAGASNEWLGKDLLSLAGVMSILIADDDERLRQGLRNLLEGHPGWRVVGEAASGREAFEKAVQLVPEVVILDISMPELDGIGAARLIRQALPQVEILVFTQHDTPEIVSRALDVGVRGYVLKSRVSRDLLAALEAVGSHTSFLSQEISTVRPSSGPKVRNEASAGVGLSKNRIGD